MNAAEIIERVRQYDADLVIREDRLVVRGRGDQLPDDLQRELREHKAELMIALGVPMTRTVASVLSELRPYLPPALRRLPDDRLLTLINWSMMAAFETSVQKVRR
jgi:hypothetical protein